MLAKIILMICGVGLIAFAAYWIVEFVRDDGLRDLQRWFVYGGKQNVLLFGRSAMWNARLWGSLMCLVPLVSVATGVWLCRCAFERRKN